jgi:hypothetical protein
MNKAFSAVMTIVCAGVAAGREPTAPATTDPPARGEVLHNGIQLPAVWPPLDGWRELDLEPMPVPYLDHPPAVIPIDVGRQLLVDDFLVEQTTLEREHHTATLHPASPVIKGDEPWEQGVAFAPSAMPFSDGVWYDPADRTFKMWYMGGFANHTCLAVSKDGIRWEKTARDVVQGTNVVQPGTRDSSTVWLDLDERDPAKRFKMWRVTTKDDTRVEKWPPADEGYVYLAVHASPDGIHWSESLKPIQRIWGDRSTVFYNPFRKVWCYSLRGNGWGKMYRRSRLYLEQADFMHPRMSNTLPDGKPRGITHWITADRLDPPDPRYPKAQPELYTLDAAGYESLMVGLFSVMRNRNPKINDICVGFSRDGFHWQRPSRQTFLPKPADEQSLNTQSAGGVCLVIGDRLLFYFSDAWAGGAGLATLRRDGFASLNAGSEGGALTTRPVSFKGKHLFVNVDAPRGELRAEVLDRDGNPVEPFTAANCLPVSGDGTLLPVRWKGAADLSALAGQVVRFRFRLTSGKLYAFWVSPDASGASHGYVAAGGPGFERPLDTVGAAAYEAAATISGR